MQQEFHLARKLGTFAALAAMLGTGGGVHAAVTGAVDNATSMPSAPSSADRSPPVSAAALMGMAPDPDASSSPASAAGAERGESTVQPRWTASASLVGQSYRYSLQHGPLDIGLRMAAPASTSRPHEAVPADPVIPFPAQLPAISLGMQRGAAVTEVRGNLLERAMNPNRGESYSSRVGVEWKPAEPRVNFIREGLGLRLDGNDRMTVRLRKGVVGIYMQRKF